MNVSPTATRVVRSSNGPARVRETSISTRPGRRTVRSESWNEGSRRPSPAASPITVNRSAGVQSSRPPPQDLMGAAFLVGPPEVLVGGQARQEGLAQDAVAVEGGRPPSRHAELVDARPADHGRPHPMARAGPQQHLSLRAVLDRPLILDPRTQKRRPGGQLQTRMNPQGRRNPGLRRAVPGLQLGRPGADARGVVDEHLLGVRRRAHGPQTPEEEAHCENIDPADRHGRELFMTHPKHSPMSDAAPRFRGRRTRRGSGCPPRPRPRKQDCKPHISLIDDIRYKNDYHGLRR